MASLIAFATESFRTENMKICESAPGMLTIASSPSHVLQSHPLLENFCTNPTRCPLESEKVSVIPAQIVQISAGTTTRAVSVSVPQFRRAKPVTVTADRVSGPGFVIMASGHVG